ncbi:MAG: hypothetical protein V1933_05865 [Candidatus Omnitrophota bacterium]
MPERIDYIWIKPSAFDSENGRLTFKTDHQKTGIITVRVNFSSEFIEDYFNLPGNDAQKKRSTMEQNKKFLFRLGLTRLEEKINNSSLSREIQIAASDIEWARRIEQKQIVPSSEEVEPGTFHFYPEKKIGFR